eukprot:g1975.t1
MATIWLIERLFKADWDTIFIFLYGIGIGIVLTGVGALYFVTVLSPGLRSTKQPTTSLSTDEEIQKKKDKKTKNIVSRSSTTDETETIVSPDDGSNKERTKKHPRQVSSAQVPPVRDSTSKSAAKSMKAQRPEQNTPDSFVEISKEEKAFRKSYAYANALQSGTEGLPLVLRVAKSARGIPQDRKWVVRFKKDPSSISNGTTTTPRATGVDIPTRHDAFTPVFANSASPQFFSTPLFSGKLIFKVRTNPKSRYARYWIGRRRNFEVQIQGKFRSQPKGRLMFGAEIRERLRLGFVGTTLTRACDKLLHAFVNGVETSFGKDAAAESNNDFESPSNNNGFVRPHIAFPLIDLVDKFIVTPPNATPPELGVDIFPSEDDLSKKERRQHKYNTRDTYSFSFYNMYFDLPNWRLVNLPGLPNVELSSIYNDMPLHFVMYEGEHGMPNLRYFFALEVNHRKNIVDGHRYDKRLLPLLKKAALGQAGEPPLVQTSYPHLVDSNTGGTTTEEESNNNSPDDDEDEVSDYDEDAEIDVDYSSHSSSKLSQDSHSVDSNTPEPFPSASPSPTKRSLVSKVSNAGAKSAMENSQKQDEVKSIHGLSIPCAVTRGRLVFYIAKVWWITRGGERSQMITANGVGKGAEAATNNGVGNITTTNTTTDIRVDTFCVTVPCVNQLRKRLREILKKSDK